MIKNISDKLMLVVNNTNDIGLKEEYMVYVCLLFSNIINHVYAVNDFRDSFNKEISLCYNEKESSYTIVISEYVRQLNAIIGSPNGYYDVGNQLLHLGGFTESGDLENAYEGKFFLKIDDYNSLVEINQLLIKYKMQFDAFFEYGKGVYNHGQSNGKINLIEGKKSSSEISDFSMAKLPTDKDTDYIKTICPFLLLKNDDNMLRVCLERYTSVVEKLILNSDNGIGLMPNITKKQKI